MESGGRPRLYGSKSEIKSAQQPLNRGETLKCSDALSLAPLEGKDFDYWVSSPNMTFVPEVPILKRGSPPSFHADGMLGALELYKWPQFYDDLEPHAGAAPMNPLLITNPQWNPRPIADTQGVLPSFGDDPSVLWMHFDTAWFCAISKDYQADIGFLASEVVSRMKAATVITREQGIVLVRRLFADENSVNAEDKHWRAERRMFMWRTVLRLQRALAQLEDIPMAKYDVILWFREVQRLTIELQGWVIYQAIIKPRIDDPLYSDPGHVLPLRGVITSKAIVADTMFRIGVPVWWVRPATSLSSAMRIVQVCDQVPSTVCLSGEKISQCGTRTIPAPLWVDTPIVDNSMRGFADHMRQFSLSSRSSIGKAVSLLADDREELPQIRGVGVSVNAATRAGQPDADAGPPTKRAKLSDFPSKKPVIPPPVVERPGWFPEMDKHWADVVRAVPDLVPNHPSQPILYAFPPLSLFYGSGETLSHRIHNWLRIRLFCINQVFDTLSDDRRILLTTTGWRTALEGNFHQVPFDAQGTDIRPDSQRAEIALLPPAPSSLFKPVKSQTASSDPRDEAPKQRRNKRPDRRAIRRTANRVDINVRFGVKGRIPPYDRADVVRWESRSIDYSHIARDPSEFGKVVIWELSLLNSRVDLFLADRRIVPGLYEQEDSGFKVLQREDALRCVWDAHGSIRPRWGAANSREIPTPCSPLARAQAFARLSEIVANWPGVAKGLPPSSTTARVLKGDHLMIDLDAFMVDVGKAYCEAFHRIFGRLPTMPLMTPAGVTQL